MITARFDPSDWTRGDLSKCQHQLGASMESSQTDSDVVTDKMRVEFSLYNTLSQLKSKANLFQFRGEEFGRLPVNVHQADARSLGAHLYEVLLGIQYRRVKVSLGRRICARHRVRSCCTRNE